VRNEYYSHFLGIKRSTHQPDAPQVSALLLDNFIPNRVQGTYVKRGGSTVWSHTGDILGLFGYTDAAASYRSPYTQWVLRHRRVGGTSFIEKLDWTTSTWMALTQGGGLAFSSAGITQAAQFGTWLFLAGGRPAKLTGPSATITRLGGPGPTTVPTWTLSAGALSGETIGYYTFYDSSSGWESSPSPFTALTTLASQKITWSALETTAFRDGVDKKRLYRSQLGASGSAPYYRITEVSLATTSYVDTSADTALGTFGPDIGDNDPPPEDSFIVAQYANSIWFARDNELWYSKTYDGSMAKLEYYSFDRVFRFPQRITGIAYSPMFGRLLVFQPVGYGIFYISGRSESTFEQDVFKGPPDGTNYATSVAVHENMVSYWGTNGPSIITPAGVVTDFAEDVKEDVRRLSTREYGGEVNVFSVWHPILEQFLFFCSATDTGTGTWEDYQLGTLVEWEDVTSGATVDWT
jgi:hypothetical protein